jgi:hypothetical protein
LDLGLADVAHWGIARTYSPPAIAFHHHSFRRVAGSRRRSCSW